MKRRAWIWGGTLATTATLGSLIYGRAQARPWKEFGRVLTSRGGPFAVRPGFDVTILSRAGEQMGDGTRSSDRPDGMACFELDGRWVLMRNHELLSDPALGAYPRGQPKEAYRSDSQGGVSRLVLDPKSLKVVQSNTVLTGTRLNCGGGPSPWGWISCEETEDPGHGYAFLCPANTARVARPHLIAAYGRFRHEAVAIEPRTARAFLTEDHFDGCIYRFTPHSASRPFDGQLEALRVVGRPRFRTGSDLPREAIVKVDWVAIEDVEARHAPLRVQAQSKGAALFARGEGIWLDGSGVVIAATAGGPLGSGQILRLDFQNDLLTTIAVATEAGTMNGPDNITVAPWGDLVVAEDGLGPTHILGITRAGRIYPILRNEQSSSELAGVCFSPDGSTLFCNVQIDGLTVAIRGPWSSLTARLS